ncbi:MAG: hypothetical protein K8T89_26290 [Planctomycetes bacterium]|nr:hypothetical protein [Planctomycetota bacterium]
MLKLGIADDYLTPTSGTRWWLEDRLGPTREPLYALPSQLLKCLARRIRNFFTSDELDQETRFALECEQFNSVGMFLAQHVPYHPLRRHGAELSESDGILSLLTDPLDRARYANALRTIMPVADEVRLRLDAFVGWLTTNAQFRQERDELRSRWHDAVLLNGRFLQKTELRSEVVDFAKGRGTYAQYRSDFMNFYRRWKIIAFATWDLPVPAGANLGGPAFANRLVGLEDDEPSMSIPSTIRLPAHLKPQQFLEQRSASQLDEWVAICEQRGPGELRYTSFERICRLNFYWNVVLAGAYPDRLRGRTGKLDDVFAEFFHFHDPETSRKLRQSMNRAIKQSAHTSH